MFEIPRSVAFDSTLPVAGTRPRLAVVPPQEPGDENRTEISQTELNRFLYLIRSNSYFLIRLYRFRFHILEVSYFKCKSRKRFRHFPTVFNFSTNNLKYFEFKIWFKPNFVNCTVTKPNYTLLIMHLCSFYWWLAPFLLTINCLFLFMCRLLY